MKKKLSITLSIFLITNSLLLADGAKIFKTCAGCHGKNANMSALNKSRKIVDWDEKRIFEALKEYKTGNRNINGGGIMMKHYTKKLSEAELKSVAKYITTLKK